MTDTETDAETTVVTEINYYKRALANAKTSIATQRDGLTASGAMTQGIADTTVTGGGWYCDEANDWLDDVVAQCAPVTGAFDDAIADVHAAWRDEPDEVDEHDWRGIAFTRQGMRRPGGPI